MKIPHKVKIKPGVYYQIVWVDKFDDPNQLGSSDDGRGTRRSPKDGQKLIYLKKGVSKKATLEIFIHEVLHAMEFEYKINFPHRLVYALQGPIALFITQNPNMALGGFLKARAAKRKGG